MHGMPVFWELMWQILAAKYNRLSILLCAKKNNFSYSHLTLKTYGFEIMELLENKGIPSIVVSCLCSIFPCFNMVANFGFAPQPFHYLNAGNKTLSPKAPTFYAWPTLLAFWILAKSHPRLPISVIDNFPPREHHQAKMDSEAHWNSYPFCRMINSVFCRFW